jgi:hypothetical protein
VIWFSLPIFEYHDQRRHPEGSKNGINGRTVLHDHLRRVLAELVVHGLKKLPSGPRAPAAIPPDLLAQHVASTFVDVLDWWVETGSPLDAKDVNALFRALIVPILVPRST